MHKNTPEEMARAVIDACADCDICRYLMEDTPCLVFPELYRLYDKEMEKGEKISSGELGNLVDLCSLCGLCPCPNVHTDLMKAKSAFIGRDGLKPAIRLMEDVEQVARLCGAYPRLTNILLGTGATGGLLKKLAGIHEERKLPMLPEESFPVWAKARGLHIKRKAKGRKVAYFAGCTAKYLFPDVAKAAVKVLQRNGVEVYFPEQKCCGIPSLLEGDQPLTYKFAAFNTDRLTEAIDEGYDIVCSCPTCGFMLKHVLAYGIFDPDEYRKPLSSAGYESSRQEEVPKSGDAGSTLPSKTFFKSLYKDEGYFASLDGRKRIKTGSHTYDLGEYLRELHSSGELDTRLAPVSGRMAYYPPCHMREQKMGEPYSELLSLVPEISLETISGSFYCCGISGIMGFKKDFHSASVGIGNPLMEKIKSIHPDRFLSDCLSCRLQFNQMVSCEVFHPIEVLSEAYGNHRKG